LTAKPALVVMFICNHCPYVKHLRAGLSAFGRDYGAKGVAIVAVNANDIVKYPADSPDQMKAEVIAAGYPFPYLFDADQTVAQGLSGGLYPRPLSFRRPTGVGLPGTI
jgi:thiol-disulfide isomerase/thioredoxin